MDLFIYTPLRALYFRGSTTLGFWGGASHEDICFSLTGTTSVFWTMHMDECQHLIEQRFDAFSTTVLFILYTLTWMRVLNLITVHFTVTQPILREIRHLRTITIKQLCNCINNELQ